MWSVQREVHHERFDVLLFEIRLPEPNCLNTNST